MKVVYLTTVPHALMAFLRDQIAFMKSRGVSVEAITSSEEDLETFRKTQPIPVWEVQMTRKISPLRDLCALVQIVRILRKLHPDIVHSSTPKAGLLGTLGAWIADIPVRVYMIRGFRFVTTRGAKRYLLRLIEKLTCRLATNVFANSHSNKEFAIVQGLCADQKIRVFGNGSSNGVDAVDRFNPDHYSEVVRQSVRAKLGVNKKAFLVGYIGRIVHDKGIADLLNAFTQLRDRHLEVDLAIVGRIESEDPISPSCLDALKSDPRVHWADLDWNIAPILSALDLLVLPSYREGFPNIILEAAAMRVPSIATNIPGCVDAVEDGATGRLISPGDSGALASAIEQYVRNVGLLALHGSNARERALALFRPEEIWEEIYQEFLILTRHLGASR